LGTSSLFCGQFTSARDHLEKALAVYKLADPSSPVFLAFPETDVACRSFLCLILQMQGHVDEAVACSRSVLAAAHDMGHAFTLSQALYLNCWLHQVRDEPRIVRERASAMLSLTVDHNYPIWQANAKALHGWALAATGAREAGITQMRQGISEINALGVLLHQPSMIGMLARAYNDAGRSDDALASLGEALAVVGKTGERWFEAELCRLKGETLLTSSRPDPAEAESSLQRALAVAREQGVKFWELRAAVSLARLWRDQRKPTEARGLLAPVYGWFTEGFDTPDLKNAKALLDELGYQAVEG